MHIRQAILEDVKDISKIHALSWKCAYKDMVPQQYLDELKYDFWVSTFQHWIANNILTVQLIFDHQRPVGCISYGKSRDDQLPNWGEVVSIYLLPNYFGKGYGQKLLECALLDMKKSGYTDIYLWVLKENLNARKFYEKNNFQNNDDECTFELMEKQLIDVRYVLSLSHTGND